MGATNCPETPRQKMITMMYLVYTAMLALNVSAEVVNGFKSVGTAMQESNKNIAVKLEDTYNNFEQALKNSPEKVREMYDRAQEVKKLSNEITAYIDSIECDYIGTKVASAVSYEDPATGKKWELPLRDESGKAIQENIRQVLDSLGFAWFTDKQLEDNHGPAQYFIGPDVKSPDPNLAAIQIKNKVLDFRNKVNEALGEDSSHVNLTALAMADGYNKEGELVPWEVLNFNEVITGAALVTLTRLKTEMMNAEFDAVNMLYKKVSKGDMTFSNITLISRPKATYILKGGTYETRINVAAYDAKQTFTATVGGQTLNSNDSGAVVYRTVCNTVGNHSILATAMVKSPDGEPVQVQVKDEYFVAEPSGVVQLEKMMVVYSGLENPISVSAPGIDARKITATTDGGGTFKPGAKPGEYILVPNGSKKEINITLTGNIDKRQMPLGTTKVRVKTIPAPIIKVGGYEKGGTVSKKTFTEGMKVAPYRAPGFDFEIPKGSMKVRKLEVYISNNPYIVDGDKLNAAMISAIRKATKGDMFAITATVLMPDGKEQTADWMVKLK